MRATTSIAAVVVLLCGPALQACSDAQPQNSGDRIIDTSADDAALNAAMLQATDTLDVFWAKFDAKPPGTDNYVVKLGMTGQDGFKEFIWAEPVRRTDKDVIARLANEPQHLRGLSVGSEVRVNRELIFDWGYERNGKMYGHFTTRALMSKMTPEERAVVEGRLSPTPIEPDAS